MTKVAVALSGGLDSAVAAALLLEQGYDVVGLTGKMTSSEDFEQVVFNAKKVAEKLGIEHFVVDVSAEFEEEVIKYFKDSYKNGETPNPCIICNKYIKWGRLFDYALNTLGVDFIATGHYANIRNADGLYKLYPASDEHKDQLYFLFLLDQYMLSKTLFPLSDFKKSEVRELAMKYDLPPKSAKESQDICFIKLPMTTKKYLNSVLDPKKGTFIEKSTGKILGSHDGHWQYTIGQRKGIGIAAPQPLYVVGIDSDKNIVYVDVQDKLFMSGLELKDFIWSYHQTRKTFEALVKIRYNMNAVRANINVNDGLTNIEFLEPVSAITPGQACVLYDINDGSLIGGGFISK